jgi:thioredoxin
MQKYILFSFLLFFVTACSNDEQPGKPSNSVEAVSQSGISVAASAATHQQSGFKLVFFLDPNGGPCRMQDSILKDMANELQGKVDIQYVQTTVPADRSIFYQYGIRALPTLLLADASGREIKRMPPGIKQNDDIRLLIQSIPQS